MVLDIQYENGISKITNLLGSISDKVLKFITKKLIEIHDQSGDADNRYKPSKQMRFKVSLFQSYFFDYSEAYIVAKGTVSATDPNNDVYDEKLAFKNNAPFISCIKNIIIHSLLMSKI